MKVTIDEKAKTVTIVMPLQEARASKTGKTMVIATTNGNKPCGAQFQGKDVILGLTAYYKPAT